MKRFLLYLGLILILGIAGAIYWTTARVRGFSAPAGGTYRSNWSPAAAASYLDDREVWWQSWPPAQQNHGAVCISCHTVEPYALVRPALRSQLGQTGMTATERNMLSSINKRVEDWSQTSPYYTGAHAASSRATESVLNALILAAYDSGQGQLSPVTRKAFDEAWALQETTGRDAGGWEWLNFYNAPWESSESVYSGAAMMAIAVGMTPQRYGADPAVSEHVDQLKRYLRREYAVQRPFNQLYVLWASARMPGLLSGNQRAQLIKTIVNLQRPDGGWALPALDKPTALKPALRDLLKRVDHADHSDGCATGLAVLSLEEAGVSLQNAALQRGLTWLEQHQYEDGSWWAPSLNGLRGPTSDTGRFMSDAATGYAVLALEQGRREQSASSAAGNENTGKAPTAGESGQLVTPLKPSYPSM